MGILDSLRGGAVAAMPDDTIDLAEQLRQERATTALLEESIAELELALDDEGWQRMAALGSIEFTRDGMRRLTALCQLMAIKNPLIKRGLALRFFYVWGEGVEISARANGQNLQNQAEQDVNQVVQDFLDDAGNLAVLTGPGGHATLERCIATDGNAFLALFTSPLTGRVQARAIPLSEVADIISDPDDRETPWYYKRTTVRVVVDDSGATRTSEVTTYHPAVGYWPATRPKRIDGRDVLWDAPIVHAKGDAPLGWKYGIPDSYAAIDWARAYKVFLEDWATLVKALSRFAWRLTAPGSKQARVRRALSAASTRDPDTLKEPNAGQLASMTADTALEAIPKTGATIDSESGRPIAAMVAAALDVPVTMLLGDPGTTGARATAETLDRPTELMASSRRDMWTGVWRQILGYVVDQAAIAPRGPLKGTVTRDGDRLVVTLAGDTNPTIDITWPDLDEDVPVDALVKAIVTADQSGKLPPLVVARLLLLALDVPEPDEILAELTDDQGEFIDPSVTAGDVAVRAYRNGADPAAVAGDPAAPAA